MNLLINYAMNIHAHVARAGSEALLVSILVLWEHNVYSTVCTASLV